MKLPKRKVHALSNGAFIVSLGVLFYTNFWWPGILLALWVYMALREWLSGRTYDLIISSVVLLGLFAVSLFNWSWSVLMPVLFVLGGIYIVFREFVLESDTNGEDIAEEIEDDADIEK